MTNDWILDVLADLRTYATENGMDGLEIRLLAAMDAARDDIASNHFMAPSMVQGARGHAGDLFRATAGSNNT